MTNQQPKVIFQNEKLQLSVLPDHTVRCDFKTDNGINVNDLPNLQLLIDQVITYIGTKTNQQNKQVYECYVEMLTTLQKIDYSEIPGLGYDNIPFSKWEETARALHNQYNGENQA